MKNKFRIYYNAKTKIFLVSNVSSWIIFNRLTESLPSFSLKRKLFKLYLKLSYFLPLPFFTIVDPLNIEEINIIKNNIEIDNLDFFYITIHWSQVKNRNRFYFNLYDINGIPIYFGKVSRNANDFFKIKNEYKFLKYFEEIKKVNIPSLISYKSEKNYRIIINSFLPKNYELFHPSKNKFPVKLHQKICGKIHNITLREISKHKWWLNFLEIHNNYHSIINYINSISKNLIFKICVVHGDFGGENIYNFKDDFYIIDWENGSMKGPFLTDILGYWLGSNYNNLTVSFIKKYFHKNFNNYSKLDITLAIAYLINADIKLAIILYNVLDEEKYFTYNSNSK